MSPTGHPLRQSVQQNGVNPHHDFHDWETTMRGKRDFTRRPNADGTFDSICMRCYLTVASGTATDQLLDTEQRHECDQHQLVNLGVQIEAEAT